MDVVVTGSSGKARRGVVVTDSSNTAGGIS